jgi:hypothetical protein
MTGGDNHQSMTFFSSTTRTPPPRLLLLLKSAPLQLHYFRFPLAAVQFMEELMSRNPILYFADLHRFSWKFVPIATAQ